MRHLLVLVLIPAVLAQGCATAATPRPGSPLAPSAGQSRANDPARLQEITEELAGEPATIELASGEVVKKAQSVRLGSEVTSWYDATGHERSVPTAEVRRVLQEQRRLIGRGFGYGAAIGVVPGILVFESSQSCKRCNGWSAEGGMVAGLLIVIAGGLVGMVVAAANRHPVVVYSGPPAPRAAGAGAGEGAGDADGAVAGAPSAVQHCRLSPSPGASPLVCAPSTR